MGITRLDGKTVAMIFSRNLTMHKYDFLYRFLLTLLPHIKGKLWISCKNGKAVKIKFYYEKQKVIEG